MKSKILPMIAKFLHIAHLDSIESPLVMLIVFLPIFMVIDSASTAISEILILINRM